MDRHVRRAVLIAVALSLVACGSTPLAPPTATELAPTPAAETLPEGPVESWFAARTATCDSVVETMALYKAQPGVVAPATARTHWTNRWCAVVPDGHRGQRADSWAQNVSAHLKTSAVAFYVADGRWSFTVFDEGLPVAALESHSGEPMLVGDAGRAAGLLEQPPDAIRATVRTAKEVAAAQAFATQVGIVQPDADQAQTSLVKKVIKPIAVVVAPSNVRFEPGTWVVMPPLGVLLVKVVETREMAGRAQEVYVVVDGSQTLPVPTRSARQMGMRPIATPAQADAALVVLKRAPMVDDVQTYRAERSRVYLESLKRGELLSIAESFAALCVIEGERTLFSIEAALKESLREWLTEELSTAKRIPADAIGAMLVEACD
ncbi:MAG: RNA polymerase-interacting CarD/CdnL/TRCF family regulator [Myxococcota bacterium]|jgi:RNA polymerase-interacting CarD/CdnL/TRCF family regulator